ncbi:type II toxin-antitoxin system VapC family toxin [Shinella sp. BYT-45]|uniref:type II toxin-antitoxin system VapC family toxin n=1 Tax=Shinella sp. BYT-45 TaxID=3377377 RepID=UPI00397FDDBA
MVVDTSAMVAVLFLEDDAEMYAGALAGAEKRFLSAVTRVEIAFVIEGRRGEAGRKALETFLEALDPEIMPVDPGQAALAIEAFRTYGKGRHPAGLNIGDCFSYALAKSLDEPLLFKGNDFALTDVRPALI